MNRDCETCIKRKTIYCLNSADCFATDENPYYQNKIMLLEEIEKLKEQYEKIYNENCKLREEHNISDISLLDENEKIKKQVENCYCNITDCASRIKDSKKYDSLEQKVEKQQQEFIDYLETEKDRLARGISAIYENDLGETKLVNEDIYNEIVKIEFKYKKIIGDKINDKK